MDFLGNVENWKFTTKEEKQKQESYHDMRNEISKLTGVG